MPWAVHWVSNVRVRECPCLLCSCECVHEVRVRVCACLCVSMRVGACGVWCGCPVCTFKELLKELMRAIQFCVCLANFCDCCCRVRVSCSNLRSFAKTCATATNKRFSCVVCRGCVDAKDERSECRTRERYLQNSQIPT